MGTLNAIARVVGRRWKVWLCGALLIGVVAFAVLPAFAPSLFGRDFWTRDQPLINPIGAVGVRDGVITLADGRAFRPAGVRPKRGVASAEFDLALATMVAQGVVVERDLGDGRAILIGEPKFYNWCGTRGCGAKNRWDRWAGGSYQLPLSPLLILMDYADPAPDEPGLPAVERWRLEGVGTMQFDETLRISPTSNAFRFDARVRDLAYLDDLLESSWKTRPVSANP